VTAAAEAADAVPPRPARARVFPARRTIPALARDPLGGFAEIGRQSGGEVVRISLGLFRPYLVTRPEHVQQVLRDHAHRYSRDGMLWKPLRRLNGNGIASDGPSWEVSRALIQPLFSGKNVAALIDPMAESITEGVAALSEAARTGARLDTAVEMTRIVHRALVRAFFGGRISIDDADRLGSAIATAFTSLGSRMLLPFMPGAVPLPGDAAFRRAVRTVDEVIVPLVAAGRTAPAGSGDIVALLASARGPDGNGLTDRQIRDDVVAMFVAGTETTALALTWLWVLLEQHPGVAAKVRDEVGEVVGAGPVRRSHIAGLTYTRQVIDEVLRLYPVGWVVPRTVKEDDVLGGVRLKAGSTVFLSPYLTQRREDAWPDAAAFDPDRFAPGAANGRHRFDYFPFGGGAHQCLGSHFFTVEAQLIVAALLSRFRPSVEGAHLIEPQASASLRPRGEVPLTLTAVPRKKKAIRRAARSSGRS
jgi:cytochrome P450